MSRNSEESEMLLVSPADAVQGGYVLLARKLLESELMNKPPHYIKLWLFFLLKAFWRDGDELKRGQFHTTIAEMQAVGGYMSGNCKHSISIDEVRSAYRYFTKVGAISVARATRGMVITVRNFSKYQCPENYEKARDTAISGYLPDTTSETTGASDVSAGIYVEKETNGDARKPRRKRSGTRTIDEEEKEYRNIVVPAEKPPAESRLFTRWFCWAFRVTQGEKYAFEKGKDGKCLAEMLRVRPWKELVIQACHVLTDSNRFPKDKAPTISFLRANINEVKKYPLNLNGKTEYFRAVGIIPPEGVNLEDWTPWEDPDHEQYYTGT